MSSMGDGRDSKLIGLVMDLSGSMRNALISGGKRARRSDGAFASLKNLCGVGREAAEQDGTRTDIFALGVGVHNTEDDSDVADLFSVLRAGDNLFSFWRKKTLCRMLEDHFGEEGRTAAYWVDKYVKTREAAPLAAFALDPTNHLYMERFLKSLPGEGAQAIHRWGTAKGSLFQNFVYTAAVAAAGADGKERAAVEEKERMVRSQLREWGGSIPERPHISSTPTVKGAHMAARELDIPASALKRVIGASYGVIYRTTPIKAALEKARDTYRGSYHAKKFLFIVSDGMPTDSDGHLCTDGVMEIADDLKRMDVVIVGCYLTGGTVMAPKQLFSDGDSSLSTGESFLLRMCTPGFRYTDLPVSLLLRRGWSIPDSGECRLFFRTNSLDVMEEFTAIVQSCLVGGRVSIDAALSVTSAFRWERYVAEARADMQVEDQGSTPTCWAHAIGTVAHHASKRVEGRVVKSFAEIRDECFDMFMGGRSPDVLRGYSVEEALKGLLPKYKLQFRIVDEKGARQAVMHGRPVIAAFWLYQHPKDTPRTKWASEPEEWNKFYQYAPRFTTGEVMWQYEVQNHTRAEGSHLAGHAVVLVEVGKDYLKFQNSWDSTWGMKGHFMIKDASVLRNMVFYDVYFTMDDLTDEEKRRWEVSNRATLERLRHSHAYLARALSD